MNTNSMKAKVVGIADKISGSKFYKSAEKAAVTASAFLTTVGISAMNAFAEAGTPAIDITVDPSTVVTNASPFIKASLSVLCVVGGIKLGLGFLKRAFH